MSPQKPLAGPPGRAALVLIAILSLLILFVLFQRNRIVKEPSNSVLQEEYAAVAPEEEAAQQATPVRVAINIIESPAGEAIKRGDLEAAEEILRHELLDRPGDENTRRASAGGLNARALSAERSGN